MEARYRNIEGLVCTEVNAMGCHSFRLALLGIGLSGVRKVNTGITGARCGGVWKGFNI